MKGINFLVNEAGEHIAVLIDLTKHGELWKRFYKELVAKEKRGEAARKANAKRSSEQRSESARKAGATLKARRASQVQ
jgi:hypothetical protein